MVAGSEILGEHRAPLDLSHHFSQVTKNRTPSSIKNYYKFFKISGIGNLASGLPNAAYFPFDTLEAEVADPSRWHPMSKDLLDAAPDVESTLLVVPKLAGPPASPATRVDVATSLQYGTAGGYPPLLSWLRQFTREVLVPHIPYQPQPDVILTTGSTDGLFKLVDLLYDSWLPARDPVSERPGLLTELFVFNNVLPAVEPHGIQLVPIEIDAEGMMATGPGGLQDVLENWDPARGRRPHVLYTVTVGHNPTGTVLSLQRKRELYAVCSKYDVIIVEDDPYWYLQFPAAAAAEARSRNKDEPLFLELSVPAKPSGFDFIDSLVPSYLSLDTDGRVIRLDTLSKTMAPGCRLGWITAQPSFIERLERITEISTQQPSGFAQAMIIQLLAGQQPDSHHAFAALPAHKRDAFSGWQMSGWVRWLAGLRAVYERRMARMCSVLDQGAHQPATKTRLLSFSWPRGGMFVWLRVHFEAHPLWMAPVKATTHLDGPALASALLSYMSRKPFLVLPAPGTMFGTTPDVNRDRAWRYLRLCFTAESEDNIEACSRRLTDAVQCFWRINAVSEMEALVREELGSN